MPRAICISICVAELLERIKINIIALGLVPARLLELITCHCRATSVVGGAITAEEGERQKRAQGVKGASSDSDALLDDGPEADFAGAEHEFGGIVVKG